MKKQNNKTKICRSCQSKNLKDILNLGNFYLSEFYKTKKKPRKYPLDIILCKKCYLLQLKYTTPQNVLYTPRYGYKSGINNTMKTELTEIVNKSLKASKNKSNPTVLDIGANDGTLLRNYSKKYYRIGVEPVKKFRKDAKGSYDSWISNYFTFRNYYKIMGSEKADIITIISCFYDMENPGEFLNDVKKILSKDGTIVIQQNYLGEMLKLNAFDNIVHEHLTYYSLLSFENLLDQHNLSVYDVEISPINGGSFRTYICNKGERKISSRVHALRKKEKGLKMDKISTYTSFAKRVEKIGKDINDLIHQEKKKGKTFYIYGASTRGNTLIQYFNLNNKLIDKAVERNIEKWGKYISSIGVPIISEKEARKETPDYMLVLPWFFKEEFIKRESNYLKSGGKLIFPLPKFEIV